MSEDSTWVDWVNDLDPMNFEKTVESLRNLARFANPATLRQLGVTLGAGRDASNQLATASTSEVATELAIRLRSNRPAYSVEPYRPSGSIGQTIRTASELREGMGTCLDFAVATAAGCVYEGIAVFLCVTVDAEGNSHAFVAIPPQENANSSIGPYLVQTYADFTAGPVDSDHLTIIDTTPLPDTPLRLLVDSQQDIRGSIRTATIRLTDTLRSKQGLVFAVHVQDAVSEGHPFWVPPSHPRTLGITSLLPDVLENTRSYASRRTIEADLDHAAGTVVLVGPSGVGKSTLALERAHRGANRAGRGWFLDGSDRAAFRLSLAKAEAQCRGESLENIQAEEISGYVNNARRRLALTSLPWVVIVDNADGPIGAVSDLVPSPGPGQLVVITSTNPDWTAHAQSSGWTCLNVEPLQPDDLDDVERALALDGSALLPGLLRLGVRLVDGGIRGVSAATNVTGLIRTAFGSQEALEGRLREHSPLLEVLIAAAVMPPEDVRQEWIRLAVKDKDMVDPSIDRLVRLGVLEASRTPRDPRAPANRTLWMHRLIRKAVRDVYVEAQGAAALVACDVLAAESDQVPTVIRSVEDLGEQARFLRAATAAPPESFPRATLTVLNALESRGGQSIATAASLAASAIRSFLAASSADLRARAVAGLAIARRANQQRDAADDEVEAGIALCEEIITSLANDETSAGRLIVGRAQAMQAILIGKKADRILARDRAGGELLLEENIAVLTRSFETRAAALGWVPPEGSLTEDHRAEFLQRAQELGFDGRSEVLDPERHVDRAWFNLGGAYIKRAKPYLTDPPTTERLELLRRFWSRSLGAYAGSLSLRPNLDLYRAASLFGIALVAYMAGINEAAPLDLSDVPRLDAISLLWNGQSRDELLRVAEKCVAEAHEIRSDVAGPFDPDTAKTRDLQTKIACSWKIAAPDEQSIESAFAALRRESYADHGIAQS